MNNIFRVLIFLAGIFVVGQAFAADELPCPCHQIYNINKAKIAFMGRLEDIKEEDDFAAGFRTRKMEMIFKIVEPWRGVPVTGQMKLKTDDTSCGYGAKLAPVMGERKIGQTFAVFLSKEGPLTICNSVIMHRSLLHMSKKQYLYFEEED
jgi:hypothetical protein